ncbi:ribonuclease H family protein [Saprospiraceae bacterium]|nr:ribonuclease H family protein [Saprospiraceae bacterium]
MAGKKKWYVVWVGLNPGIYNNWNECKAQIQGFPNAKYKGFETVAEAQIAFRSAAVQYQSRKAPASKGISTATKLPRFDYAKNPNIILPSLSVDAACSGNPGLMEYRGVVTETGQQIFHKGPFKRGTNNIGEFLALVHGLAYMKLNNNSKTPIYTDSKTAMAWVRKKTVKTTLKMTKENTGLFDLLHRGEKWLRENSHRNPILKWETKSWGEIPADFGRK